MLTQEQIAAYRSDGFIVVPGILSLSDLVQMRQVIARLIDHARTIDVHDEIYDLEPGHTRDAPKVRRIKSPHKVDDVFNDIIRSERVLGILRSLIGSSFRLHGSKLNMKAAHFGSPVEWHQDWAFYPHTNDDILAIGVFIDDMALDNGPLLCVPGSHRGPVWDHHGSDGRFCGAIDPNDIIAQIERAVPLTGLAGSMSFHHVRTLHGSAQNQSNRPRNLLLYEIAAADAWPLKGVPDLEAFDANLMTGNGPTIAPRLADVPVRIPLPPPLRQGSIYETQSAATDRQYFKARTDAA
ncbi:MAG: phytanoyl-CoA dioxygenase family protein [Proteobacteria bacterium]|nr:phytanoyl-CoA dioxygenase family protein [Pseudomonadota bacterium]